MGGENSKGPILEKHTEDLQTPDFRVGVCEMQGWRRTMEDATLAIPNFNEQNSSLFGVMDGHGGPYISKFVASNFGHIFTNLSSYKNENYEQALIETFLKLDEYLRDKRVNRFLYQSQSKQEEKNNYDTTSSFQKDCKQKTGEQIFFCGKTLNLLNKEQGYNNRSTSPDRDEEESYSSDEEEYEVDQNNNLIAKEMGTTANILLINKNSLFLANVGDSLSVMFKNGVASKMNLEHKTTVKSEYERITKSGGHIINNRINGKLNLTRAIGDLGFKSSPNLKFYEQSVTAFPEITKFKHTQDIDFIVMACDGVWDCVEEQGFCEAISEKIKENPERKLSSILAEFFDQMVSKSNNIPIGTDNMSCILIQFQKNGK